jgi:hypothetical protein
MTLSEQIKQLMELDDSGGITLPLEVHSIIRQLTDIVKQQHEVLEGILPQGGMHYDHVRAALALSAPIVKGVV